MTSDANIDHNRDNPAVQQTPIYQPPAGPIVGRLDPQTGVQCFLGIPYTQPPQGELRWQPPRALAPWHSPLRAFTFGMPAAQPPSPLFKVEGPNGEAPEGEDCLTLNIYSPPAAAESDQLPVMLWIHGGSFYMGAGSQEIYSGRHLAASGRAIVVTFNYRLGALGFLRLADISDIPASGNEALLDQVAALEWVRENIAAFGGDPDNITLFGESAGAMCIAALLAAPRCRGLFRRAIVQSGNPCAMQTPERANHLAEAFLGYLEKSGEPPLRASVQSLLRAQQGILSDPRMEQSWGQLPFKPVLDGELLTTEPMIALQGGGGADVSLMLGNNLDEWNLFSATDAGSMMLDDAQIRSRLEWLLPRNVLDPILAHYYQRARSMTDNPWPEWSRAWNLMLTDMVFTLPGIRLLKAHGGRRYHYQFAQPLAAQPLLGACHAVELGYVFGTHGEETLQSLYGGETAAHSLSESMREAWLNFAECGDPGDGWPAFSEGHSRRFGQHPEERPFDAEALSQLWQHVPDDILKRYL